ncbi:hypothetical protein [Pontiella agarivorans]|uniref:Uncharacterized protein n=1 Tax=Pontiella agarivorans TaxID=3038953 RepID=A0ABU5MYL9_9BACT|nr:hypothetical protein [Pontiella agarivorans]MDZ8119284.1 hypothetical protein [Pontiella agarivorans]
MSASVRKIQMTAPYKEETVTVPAVITALLIVMIAVPLVLWIIKINDAGTRAASRVKYEALIAEVENDSRMVNAFLSDNAAELEAIRIARQAPVVTLIVPEVVIVDERENQTVQPLNVELDGIYWSVRNPLAGMNGEMYSVGDVIQGYEIVQIDKLSVRFIAPDGSPVVKEMYEDLLNSQK